MQPLSVTDKCSASSDKADTHLYSLLTPSLILSGEHIQASSYVWHAVQVTRRTPDYFL